jgi:hypothetical protein
MKAHGDFKDFISLMNAGGVDSERLGPRFLHEPRATSHKLQGKKIPLPSPFEKGGKRGI